MNSMWPGSLSSPSTFDMKLQEIICKRRCSIAKNKGWKEFHEGYLVGVDMTIWSSPKAKKKSIPKKKHSDQTG